MPLSASIREVVRARATFQCEYCQTVETLSGMKCEVDHIVPKSRGGSDQLDNLCAACALCNSHKHTKIYGTDPDTMQRTHLFDPRSQQWHEHFRWNENGTDIIGLTTCGRATVNELALNEPLRVAARSIWVQTGRHPPR